MEQTPSTTPTAAESGQSRFQLIDDASKRETTTSLPPGPPSDLARPSTSSKSPSHLSPAPSAGASSMAARKKGTAAAVKKAPKRPKNGPNKAAKKLKPNQPPLEEPGPEEESDHGPYCICRGPDDHRWMICCEKCEDWFHGECIKLDKDIGESLIEKFICPNCTNGNLFTLYKKTCTLGGCKKPARLNQADPSVFCSKEHAHTWWERMVGRLPKMRGKGTPSNQLTQEEFMALLESGMSGVNQEGLWTLAREPFAKEEAKSTTAADATTTDDGDFLSAEEKGLLKRAEDARFHLAEETLLCHKMLDLIELAQERRRAAITAGRFGDEICGYDQRLDTVLARDVFTAYVKSPGGEAAFKARKLGDPAGKDDPVRGMCERKRCKIHSGWYKMLVLGIKYQIREMAGQASEVSEEERSMREAARERWRRKRAEKNWVEVLDE